ncbi:MAG: FtsQ-type POTRA domain-containing protein [Thermoleophilaceae bacterium]|nr:FtsQ-type POTRA domain-containing protein [Thermoleophilaceae bacterium]
MLSVATATLRAPLRLAFALPPRLRRRLALLLVLVAALGAIYWFWFRDSSFARVEQVSVTGLTTGEAPRVRKALTSSAAGMSTLKVDRQVLLDAVAANPLVHEVRVTPDFPHGLRIHVVENRPVAVSGAERTPVASDGTLLRGLPVEGKLPALKGPKELAALPGAAPPELLERLSHVRRSARRGVVARLRSGPLLVFGEPERLRAKWEAASRVLADGEARGATYVDVSLPERPVAGGLGANSVEPVSPAGAPDPAGAVNTPPPVESSPVP